MPTYDDYTVPYRDITPLIRAWERELSRKGWQGSPRKMCEVARRKAIRNQQPPKR